MTERTRVLVIGAGGFVASHVIPFLIESGHQVVGLLRSAGKAERVRSYGAEVVYGDVTDALSIKAALEGITHVVHLVGISREIGEAKFKDVVEGGTVNILSAVKGTDIKVIYMSAMHTTDKTDNLYLLTKYLSEQHIKNSGQPFTIFNSSFMYGPRSPFINMMANFAIAPFVPVLGPGTQLMQPIFAKDTAAFVEKAVSDPASNNVQLNISGPDVVSYDGLINMIAGLLGRKNPAMIHFPMGLAKFVADMGTIPVFDQLLALPSRLTVKNMVGVEGEMILIPPVTPQELQLLQMDFTCDITITENALSYKTTPLREGLIASLGLS